jgi:hypothetical protein
MKKQLIQHVYTPIDTACSERSQNDSPGDVRWRALEVVRTLNWGRKLVFKRLKATLATSDSHQLSLFERWRFPPLIRAGGTPNLGGCEVQPA